ncbi:MAG: O-antigen ligase family protein [Chloroflexales bacterium]
MLRQVLQWIVHWELLFIALLAPLLLFPASTYGLAMAGVPLLWGLRWLDQRHFIRRTPLDWSICLLLLMVMVSSMVTFDPALSLPKITGVVLGVACYYGLAARLEQPREIWLGIAFMIAVGCGVAMLSLLGTSWFDKIPAFGSVARLLPVAIRSLPGSPADGFQPNQVAGALVWLLPLLLILFWRYRTRDLPQLPRAWRWPTRILFLLALLLIGGVMLLAQSRGGYFGLLCGTLALFVLPRRHLLLVAEVLIGVGIIAAIIVGPQAMTAYEGVQSLQSSQALSSETLQSRFEVWSRAIYAIQDFPITGMGMGTFRRVMPVLYPAFSLAPDFDVGHAHNHLLNAALDIGIPGLIAYLAIWLGAAAMAGQALRRSSHDDIAMLTLGLSGGMLAYFVYGLTDTNALGSKPGLLMWLAFGLVFCLYRAAVAQTIPQRAEDTDQHLDPLYTCTPVPQDKASQPL